MELSLIIPTYNEGKNIEATLKIMLDFLETNFESFEMIVVDDGSKDQTVSVLKSIKHPSLVLLPLKENKGKGNAIKAGMLKAQGHYCFFTDADLPYELKNIKNAIEISKKTKSSLVIGSRHLYEKKHAIDYPFHRKIMSKGFSIYNKVILNLGITDTQCGFKGFTYQAAKTIFPLVTIEGFGFDVEVLFIAKNKGLKIELIPVSMRYTDDSKVNIIKDSLKMMKDTLKIRYNHLRKYYQ